MMIKEEIKSRIRPIYYGVVDKLPFPYKLNFIGTPNLLTKKAYGETTKIERNRREIEKLSEKRLNSIIFHATQNIPFYRELKQQKGCRPINLSDFPLLDKSLIKKNESNFIWQRKMAKIGYTSGSTGTPFRVFYDNLTDAYMKALEWRHKIWTGYSPEMRRVTIRGTKLKGILGRETFKQVWGRELLISSYFLTKNTAQEYIKLIEKWKPYLISSYPTVLYYISKKAKKPSTNIGAIITSSETLYNYQKEAIEDFFGAKIYDIYGSGERIGVIGQCATGEYHIFENFSYIEILDKKGKPVKRGKGEIVATTLTNQVMPLIRYRTGDLAIVNKSKAKCGIKFRTLSKIIGKEGQMLKLRDGRVIPGIFMTLILSKYDNLIHEWKVHQKRDLNIEVYIVPLDYITNEQIKKIKADISKNLGGLKVDIQIVERIERKKSGKLIIVESEVTG